eukprot:GHVR01161586.1.p1 GENE.GHVR01161586.1~~GHVR01161586.1.p1  ORF type:complete len:125 (-),score=1.54 GHVR01161586.1:1677-2051(-)
MYLTNSLVKLYCRISHAFNATLVDYSPDGNYIVTGGKDKAVRVWNAETGSQVMSFVDFQSEISYVSFTKYILIGDMLGTIKVYSYSEYVNIHSYKKHSARVNSIVYDETSGNILSVSDDKMIVI